VDDKELSGAEEERREGSKIGEIGGYTKRKDWVKGTWRKKIIWRRRQR